MRNVLALSRLYFLGSLRRQAHLATLFLGVVLLMMPAYINAFSLGVNAFERVSKDFGITLISYFGAAMTILLASTSIPRDLETRAIYPILARPINRIEYVLAHLISTLLLVLGSLILLGGALMVSLGALTRTADLSIFLALGTLFMQLSILASLTIAISTVASPALAGTGGAFIYLVGSMPGAFIRFFLVEDRESSFASTLATGLKALLPNLSLFNLKEAVVHGLDFNVLYLPAIALYAILWVSIGVLLSAFLFGKRDL